MVRYTNREVLNHLESVYADLKHRLANIQPLQAPLSWGLAVVAVELTDFSVFYSQDSIANAEAAIKTKGSRIVVEKGQIVKVSKDHNGIVTREVLTKNWTDWIDYWAVDFDFESKREIIRVQSEDTGEWEERWTGDFIFENEWQSFRTKKDRSLELKSVFHECAWGRRKIAVKYNGRGNLNKVLGYDKWNPLVIKSRRSPHAQTEEKTVRRQFYNARGAGSPERDEDAGRVSERI